MRRMLAPLELILARVRGRPARWLLPVLGIAVATAFAGAVAAEGTIAADRGVRAVLQRLTAADRTVRVSWEGPVSASVERQSRAMLRGLGLGDGTEVVLLNPVRLSGIVVRPAAIATPGDWLATGAAARLGPCRASRCPMLLVGGGSAPARLTALGVDIRVAGEAPLRSAVPLGFAPAFTPGMPVLLTGDVAGLDAVTGLSGVYRSHDWLAVVPTSRLHSWNLAGFEARLQRLQAGLIAHSSQFSVSAPFTGFDAARAQADAAPQRLLLAGGGAAAAFVLFIVLAAGGLRDEELREVQRLQRAGARTGQCVLFLTGEAAAICAVALALGAGLAILVAMVLAGAAGEPTSAVLAHSVVRPAAALALLGGWLIGTLLVASAIVIRDRRLADALGLGALTALGAALITADSERSALAAALAPLCCLAAGVLVFRATAPVLRLAERVSRRGPLRGRLALVGLGRSPGLPSLAVAFVAVSTGLGGFALAYRATLIRGAADQAADAVPLGARIAPAPDFTAPLQLAPLERWRALAGGPVLPVRRAQADYLSGAGNVIVPALGVPADGLDALHGWRGSDGSAPLDVLARRLRPPGPVRVPGPVLPGAGELALVATSPGLNLTVTADLRDGQGAIHQLVLGVAGARRHVLRARLPAGRLQLAGFELDEPTGLDITNGHQNGENVAAATQFSSRVSLGPLLVSTRGQARPVLTDLGGWTGVGAVSGAEPSGPGRALTASFQTTGWPGIVRPREPSDTRPVPVLVDPSTAASAAAGGLLALTVDGLPVNARIVGVLRRFPTLDPDPAGFVVADEATLAAALDAQLPGQGEANELWVGGGHLAKLRAFLGRGRASELSSSFRADIERDLREDPITRGVLGTLLAAAALAAVLAVLGLLVVVRGAFRDPRIEEDLSAQGFGPRWQRAELRLRLMLAGGLGLLAGGVVAVVLTRLAAGAVQAGYLQPPLPPLVTVIPWGQLAAAALGGGFVLLALTWLGGATAGAGRGRPPRRGLAGAPERRAVGEAGQ